MLGPLLTRGAEPGVAIKGKARGGEASVPRLARGRDGDYHQILVRTKGSEGAEGVKRTKKKASKLLKSIAKEIGKGRAFFPFEAAMHSEHEDTGCCGGGIDEDDLKELLGEIPALEPGQLSDVLETKHGLHLVWRPPAEPEDEDLEEDEEE